VLPLFGANWVLAALAIDRFLKTIDLSRSGTSIEIWGQNVASREHSFADQEVIEFVLDRSTIRSNLCASVIVPLLAIFLIVCCSNNSELFFVGCVGFVFCIGFGIRIWWASDGCLVRADRQSVFGYPARFAIHRRLLHWSEIASCEIITRFDTFGKPFHIVPVFKDAFGRTLMRLSLCDVPMEFQERLLKHIKARLPKARVDLAEL
jgi:hypothetical protein